ncbi:MAG: hypothetical protein QW594_01420 [Candidatus Woesearchaeota archaeon]
MLSSSILLRHYKKKWIQEEILRTAQYREVAVRYNEMMGKRPDVLYYPNDIFEHAKKNATSFHLSEEHWHNPLLLAPGLKKKDLDALRRGWDLVLDIDFPDWTATKLIATALVEALEDHGITSYSCKFSGNKGFHLAVPFEAFPPMVHGTPLPFLFPVRIKKIAEYLIYYIDNPSNNYQLSKKIFDIEPSLVAHAQRLCKHCHTPFGFKSQDPVYECSRCGYRLNSQSAGTSKTTYPLCPSCHFPMDELQQQVQSCSKCSSSEGIYTMNLQIDTILMTSRHLYRSVFSLHEKSGLVSLPVDPKAIFLFSKTDASPELLPTSMTGFFAQHRFLDSTKVVAGQATKLVLQAFDFRKHQHERQHADSPSQEKTFIAAASGVQDQEYISQAYFPPSITKLLQGVEDGRKRGLFILLHFLRAVGWKDDAIEQLVLQWNEKNKEPLKGAYLQAQLSYFKRQQEVLLPPNYDNVMYYRDLGILHDEELVSKYKNPVQWAKAAYTNEKLQHRRSGKEKHKKEKKINADEA